jgi:hypothetical protein
MRIETLAVHAGHDVDAATSAVTPPIHLSTTFARETDGSYKAGFLYSRYANPNRTSLEQCLAALEGGAVAAAFSSGSAATMTLVQSLGPNSHVIAPDDAYFGTLKLVRDIFGPWGVELSVVDMTNLEAVESALRPNTKLIWAETPSNPLLRVVDIAELTAIAHRADAICAVDNTWGTPVLQRPRDRRRRAMCTPPRNTWRTQRRWAADLRENGGCFSASPRARAEARCPLSCWLTMRDSDASVEHSAGNARTRAIPREPSRGRSMPTRDSTDPRTQSRASK